MYSTDFQSCLCSFYLLFVIFLYMNLAIIKQVSISAWNFAIFIMLMFINCHQDVSIMRHNTIQIIAFELVS